MGKIIDRTGEINKNTFGTEMKIIKYINNRDVIVEFQDKYKTTKHVQYDNFIKGIVSNPYDKTVYGIGYLGKGEYKCGAKNSKIYNVWCNMLTRCYNEKLWEKGKYTTYKNVFVCDEWHNFQNFAKWWTEQLNLYKDIKEEEFDLDKDILIKHNKLYCPQNCIPSPKRINNLFTKSNSRRGKYPIGVTKSKYNTYMARCDVVPNEKYYKNQITIGSFNTPEEAFYAYKQFKENYIKEVANEYKDRIPQKLYEAMYRYEVEITD